MAKRKSRLSSSGRHRQNFVYNSSLRYPTSNDSSILQKNLDQERWRQTRDYQNKIANEQLSFAEDLRRYTPDRKKFHNIDGSVAETTYKPVLSQKKSIVRKLVLYGVICLVSYALGTLLSANVVVNAGKYFSLIKFW